MPREAASRLFTRSICPSCRAKIFHKPSLSRPFSTISPLKQTASPPSKPPPRAGNAVEPLMSGLSKAFMTKQQQHQRHPAPNRFSDLSDLFEDATKAAAQAAAQAAKAHRLPVPHHFHVYATKHNTHIAL